MIEKMNILRPPVSEFNLDDNLFIYDIEEDSNGDGGYRFYLFCIGELGHSVTLVVEDCPVPLEAMIPDKNKNEEDVEELIRNKCAFIEDTVLNIEFKNKQKYKGFDFNPMNKTVNKENVLEMTFSSKKCMYMFSKILREEWDAFMIGRDTPTILKFFLITGIKPSSWIKCENMRLPNQRQTTDQLEFSISYKYISLKPEVLTIPRLIIAGFDIETDNPNGFCNDGTQSIICISTFVYIDDVKEELFTHYLKNPHSIDNETRETFERQISNNNSVPSNPLKPKGTIYYYKDERKMLLDWKKLLTETINADIITGYNIYGYDWSYICERMIFLSKQQGVIIPHQYKFEPKNQFEMKRVIPMKNFFSFSKLKNRFTGLVETQSVSVAMGKNILHRLWVPGRIQVDLLQVIKNHQTQKMVDAKLNTVSQHFLGETKEDLKAPDIFKIWRLGYEKEIIAYCETDAILPVRLMFNHKLKVIIEAIELSKLAITPLNHILNNGKTKYIKNMTIWMAHQSNIVLNIDLDEQIQDNSSYAGAEVMHPVPGKHDTVLVYDFNSLYPSIMQYGNLCPSSFLLDKKLYDPEYFNKFEIKNPITGQIISTNYFVKKSIYEGLLPKMLFSLVTERKKDQRKMAEIKEHCAKNNIDIKTTEYEVLNAAQLGKKIIANSVYGVCAFSGYKYGAKEISETTTAVGRDFIQMAKNFIEDNYKHYESRCVYGDTDSVFMSIACNNRNLLEVLKIAEEIEKACAKIFPKGIVLGFEKIVKHLILSNRKKRYIGMIYEPNPNYNVPENYDIKDLPDLCKRKFFKNLIYTGFSPKKKGEPKIVTNIIKKTIEKLMNGVSEIKTSKYIQEYIMNIDKNVNLDDFVFIRRIKDKYGQNPPYQMNAVLKLKHRKLDAPESGSYVPYVILTPDSAHKLSDFYTKDDYIKKESTRSEDPNYLKELTPDKYEIDFEKYISAILKDIESIFHVFPKLLYNIKNTSCKKNALIRKDRTFTLFDIFGGSVEMFLPNHKEVVKIKSNVISGNVKNMFMSISNKRKSPESQKDSQIKRIKT